MIDETKREIKKSKRKDYYKILELQRNATQEQIKKQYKTLSKKYHPDKNHGNDEKLKFSEKMFRDVNESYKALSDPQKKRLFDCGLNPDDAGILCVNLDFQNNDFHENDCFNGKDTFYENHRNNKSNKDGNSNSYHNDEEINSKNTKKKSKFDISK